MNQLGEILTSPLTGTVRVPGDKSISHRALLVAALAEGRSRLEGLNTGEDVGATLGAVRALGARCTLSPDRSQAQVEGWGSAGPTEAEDVIDAGNSGTTMRLVAGVCATIPGVSVLTGDESLRRRPMARIAVPLRSLGAAVDGRRGGELPPLIVRGGDLHGTHLVTEVASAQVKSALLLAALGAPGITSITEPSLSRDHTERLLGASGVVVERSRNTVTVAGGQCPAPLELRVPGDISSAIFLLVAATLIPGSDLTVVDVGLNPTRCGALEVLRRMGAQLDVEVLHQECGEPVGRVRARASSLVGVRIGGEQIPSLIDEIPALAIAAAHADGATTVAGAAELRVKESDRIGALVEGLGTLGARARALPDGMVVEGPAAWSGGDIDERGDHRIALAFALAGLTSGRPVRIKRWEAVNTSFPEFWDIVSAARGERN
jgi:3-phosphoshikimate 1-carboxyvinyltransferase